MAKQRSNHRKKNRFLLCAALLLLCGIGAEGVLLYRRAAQPAESSAAEGQPVRDPAAELTDALRREDYAAAEELLRNDVSGASVPEEAVQLLTDRAKAVCADYDAEKISFTDANTALQAIMKPEIPAVREAVQPMREELRLREAARTCYRKAADLAAAGEYQKAAAQYRLIPKTETALYADAQEQIGICMKRLQAETEAEAEAMIAAGEYDAAAELLQKALLDLPEAQDLQEQLDAAAKKQQAAALHEHLKAARIRFDAKDYPAAFAALRELPELPETPHIMQSYQKMYQLRLQTETLALLEAGKLEEAESMIAEAEEILPKRELPAQLRTELAAYMPVQLSALEAGEFADFSLSETALTDAAGTEYPADGNLYLTYDGDLTGRQRSSGEFRTNGQYSHLSLTAAPKDDFSAEFVFLEISGDGKQLETYAVSKENGVLHIDLDITGIQLLRLRVQPYRQEDLRNSGVILAEGTVRK